MVALVAGCHRAAPQVTSRTVVDGKGRTLGLPPAERVRRVVSLAPSTTEILYALGAGSLVVGVDRYSDYPAAAKALPQLGADVDPSLERIVALRPDVVFTATSANTQATVETLERLHLTTYVSTAASIEEIGRDVAAIGAVVGRDGEAARLAADLRARVQAVRARHAGKTPVKALVVVWSDPLVVAGHASAIGDLLAAAGGANLADDSAQPFPTYSLERVVARAPEVLVVGTHSVGSPPVAPLERLADRLGARRFRIAGIDGDLLFRPGPRVADGVEALEKLLHPRDGGAP